jgi:hypothetical protein
MFIAQPVGITTMEIGKAAANTGPLGHTAFGATCYIVGTMLLAMYFVFKITQLLNSSVTNIIGRTSSNIHGRVKAELENSREPLDVRTMEQNHLGGLREPVAADGSGSDGAKLARQAATAYALRGVSTVPTGAYAKKASGIGQ